MSDKEIKVKVTDRRHWVKDGEKTEDPDVKPYLERLPTYVEKLEKQMLENDAKLKEYISAYKKRIAENDEFRARLQKDVDRRVETGMANFIKEVLPVMDNFDLAIESTEASRDMGKLIEGVSMIKSGLLNVLLGYGMKEIDCLGKEFDPAVAEAVHIEKVKEEEKDNRVLEVLQPGFMLNEMLIRPARVKVGRLVKGE